MRRLRLLGTVCACVACILTSNATCASLISVSSNTVVSGAFESSSNVTDFFTSTAIPSTDTLTAINGNSSSTTDINYTGNASSATFTYGISHSIDNTTGDTSASDYAQSSNTSLYFTVNSATTYSIDGYYAMTGPAGTRTLFWLFLRDITAGNTNIFIDDSESFNTVNESFVLGVSGDGDYSNNTSGSLVGDLIAGHDYQFFFTSRIQAFDGSNSTLVAATAEGAVNLSITTAPVPPALWLFGSGLLGLIGISRRKKA